METNSTYTPPAALSIIDDDAIHARMLEVIPDNLDKTTGGFVYDFTRPAALEKAEAMIQLNDAIQVFFPEWSYSGFLDKIADMDGLVRRSATAAEGYVMLEGTPGTTIPKGFLFSTPATAISAGLEFAALEAATIGEDGNGKVLVQCVSTGVKGNVTSGTIIMMSKPISGVKTVTNAPITGGTEEEDDDSLRQRIKDRDLQGNMSFVGNDADYKRWAQEVDGVGSVVVVPEWKGKGTGTVKLIVMDANGSPANSTILAAVYNHIISPETRDKRLAPIGAILTVVTTEPVELTITADVSLEDGYDVSKVSESFRLKMLSYFEEAKKEACVRYTRVASTLSETPGVLDYAHLLVNGSVENIPVTVDNYPSIKTISLGIS